MPSVSFEVSDSKYSRNSFKTYSLFLATMFVTGVTSNEFPHVMLLDISDGKASIVRVAQKLCEKARAGEITPDEVDLGLVHNFVLKEVGVPEPELGLYCGDVCSLFGFLPWHSRITEFL